MLLPHLRRPPPVTDGLYRVDFDQLDVDMMKLA